MGRALNPDAVDTSIIRMYGVFRVEEISENLRIIEFKSRKPTYVDGTRMMILRSKGTLHMVIPAGHVESYNARNCHDHLADLRIVSVTYRL